MTLLQRKIFSLHQYVRWNATLTLPIYSRHGDMLYLMPGEDADRSGTPDGGQQHQQHTTVVEDEVDQILEKMDGRIHRSRNEQL